MSQINSFKDLVRLAPKELQHVFWQQWKAPQNPNYHPEGNTLKHIAVVVTRAIKNHPNDIDMILAAFFHDLGKFFTLDFKNNQPTAHGHEKVSIEFVDKYNDWIESLGGNPEKIKFIVENHMKIKPQVWDVMKQSKKDKITTNPNYQHLSDFGKLDKGGLHEDSLNEAISNNLYHYTGVDAILNILKNNRILLSSSLGTESDNYGHKPFFLSTARTPSLDAGYANSGNRSFRLVLDKDKLEQKFKTKPVDYWQRKDPNNPILKTLRPADRSHRMNRDFEFEERIYSDKPYLDNALNYIKEIEIFVNPDDLKSETTVSHLVSIRDIAKEKNIPIQIYSSKSDLFKKQNPITYKLQSTEKYQEREPSKYDNEGVFEELFALLLFDEKYFDSQKGYDLLKDDIEKFKIEKIFPNIKIYNVYQNIRSLYYSSDLLQPLISELHNTFKGGKNNTLRKNIHLLVNELKRNKVNSIKELYNVKVKGLNPKKTNHDYTNKVKLYYKSSYEDEPNQPIPSNTPLEKVHGMYFNTYKYNGQLSDADGEKYFNLRTTNGTLGDFINYIYNKYTPKKADQIFKGSADDRVLVSGLTD